MADVFDRAAMTYDAVGVDFFSTVGRILVEDAGIRAGERVLDLGCGRGAVLFPAAERVGPEGSVTGVDLAPTMVQLTAQDAHERGLDHVMVQVMDVQEPSLPEHSYDVVTAYLVVFFLPDPPAALEAWRRLLVPGGRLAMTTFAGDDERWSWLEQVFATDDPAGCRPRAVAGLVLVDRHARLVGEAPRTAAHRGPGRGAEIRSGRSARAGRRARCPAARDAS